MERALRLGRSLFGVGTLSLGVLNFAFAGPVLGLEPLPEWLPAGKWWAYTMAVLLVVGGLGVMSDRLRPYRWATALSVVFSAWFFLLQLPALVTHMHSGSRWAAAFECLAICSAAWVLASTLQNDAMGPLRRRGKLGPMATLGRYGFGVSLPVFGVLHFVYWQYTASVIPGWIPGSPVFWTYFTGCAHIAAGVALLSGVQSRLAATMLGIMFGSWVFIVHVPRVIAGPHIQSEWTSLCIAITLCGGAWLVSGYLARDPGASMGRAGHAQQMPAEGSSA
jgi:uncharacterized membrane protein